MSFLYRLQTRIAAFMQGRNGMDRLNWILLIASFVWTFLTRFLRNPWLSGIGYLLLGLALFRMLSTNIYQRQRENRWALSLPMKWRTMTTRLRERREYKYFACDNCRQKMRVPRGKGKIKITCHSCGEQMIKKV